MFFCDRKATGRRQESDRFVEEDKGDKIVHGFLYGWIYMKKMRTNVLHLFGFLLRCHFIVSGIDFYRLVNFNLFWNHYILLYFNRKISLLCDIMMVSVNS